LPRTKKEERVQLKKAKKALRTWPMQKEKKNVNRPEAGQDEPNTERRKG